MKKKSKNKELSNPRLRNLQKDFEKIQKGEKYLEIERKKLMKEKNVVRNKIKKEKGILRLKNQIVRMKSKKVKK